VIDLKILDLFCGAGGSAEGLRRATLGTKTCRDLEIVGYDIKFQPYYPFKQYTEDWKKAKPADYDFIWASPPCQGYSRGGNPESRKKYPKLIEPVRDFLLAAKRPFVIENVIGAPLRKDLLLCGEMFKLKVIRHRIFEIHGFVCEQPIHPKHNGTVSDGDYIMVCRGGRPGCFGNKEKRNKLRAPTLEQAQNAMGINHSIKEFGAIAEAIPPVYSEYILRSFLGGICE
jgi:DNA (cytosine-5)-methyltransferase 1